MTLIGSPQDDKHGRGKPRPYGEKSGRGHRRRSGIGIESGCGNRRGSRNRHRIEIESGSDSSQHLVGGARLFDVQRDLVGDADAVAFEGDDFFRVIRQDADVLEAEVDQDLRADATFMLDHALAGRLAIELAAFVKMDLREGAGLFGSIDREAASSVMQIEKDAAVFLGDGGE